jgi:cytochrome P450
LWQSDEMKNAPQAPYFDASRGVWVLTRFSDVSAALHEPELWPVAPNGEGQLDDAGRTTQGKNRSEVLAALHASKIAEWRAEFAPLAAAIATALPPDRVIDVVGEFARPWSLLLAAKVVGIEVVQARRLEPLAARVTSSTAAPENVALKADASAAGAELDQAFANSRLPMAGPAFIALSQTLPCLLANAWLILLHHPAETEQIAANPELLPRAVDELLRLAGLARVVHRQAIADVKLGETSLVQGQRVDLMLEAANYDSEQFPNPERLDLTRRAAGHFALGAGDHSCVAASLIRMAMGIATGVFVEQFVPGDRSDAVEWLGGSGFRWPAALYARKRK